MSHGNTIVREFVERLCKTPGLSVKYSSISRNVVDVSGRLDCLAYVKGRGEAPYRWGVTANVISRLRRQPRRWFVVLLYELADTGYFLTPKQVSHNIVYVWPLGKDGDYKPSSGTYLATSTQFFSFKEFLMEVSKAKGTGVISF